MVILYKLYIYIYIGHGRAIVYGTGRQTEFGMVFDVVDNVEERKTPLQMRMDGLANQLSIVSLGTALFRESYIYNGPI